MAIRFGGRSFTVLFAIGVGVLLVFGLTLNERLTAISEQIELLRQKWPRVAESLESRFEIVDQAAQETPTDALAAEWLEQRKRYDKTAIYDNQARQFPELFDAYEKMVANVSDAKQTEMSLTSVQQQQIDEFIVEDRTMGDLLSGLIGKVTSTVLVLDYPPRVYPFIDKLLPPQTATSTASK